MQQKNSDEADTQVFEQTLSESSPLGEGELMIATIVAFDNAGKPLVNYHHHKHGDESVAALTTISVQRQHLGRQVATLFVDQDYKQPVIIGIIRNHLDDVLDASHLPQEELEVDHDAKDTDLSEQDVLVDGKKVHISAKDEIVLQCGESSITLTKSGKILIRGKYVLNRSSGVNRIMGGSVQVN